MLIIPQIQPNYIYPEECCIIHFQIKDQGKNVGESHVLLVNYKKLLSSGKSIADIGRYSSTDVDVAFSAMSKLKLLAPKSMESPGFMCRTPVIAYLSRIYIYPEFRRHGYGKEFLKKLPVAIEETVLTRPVAISVYISPQHHYTQPDGTSIPMNEPDVRRMERTMKNLFKSAGYKKPSRLPLYSSCFCWVDDIKQHLTDNDSYKFCSK